MKQIGFIHNFIKNFSYSFAFNIINLLTRGIYILILPKLIGVADFGYWQLYLLYTSLIHFCHLGLVDGIYLKNAGLLYNDLDKIKIRPQFFILGILGIIFAILLNTFSNIFVQDENKLYLFMVLGFDIILMLPRTLLSVIFQTTGMIKEFSLSLMSEAFFFFFFVMLMLLSGIRDFKILILGDIAARIISLSVSCYFAFDFVKFVRIKVCDFHEAFANIKVGIFLLLANMLGTLSLAIVRLVIENIWGIIIFSKFSLAFNIANIMMSAISAASIVLFPMLKRLRVSDFTRVYISVLNILLVLLFCSLISFYPIISILNIWLPKYQESFKYVGIIAPLCIYDGLTVLLLNNYLKAMRKERIIFKISILNIIFIILCSIGTVIFNLSINLLIYSVLFSCIFKALFANYVISISLEISTRNQFLYSFVASLLFIISNYYIGGLYGFLLYAVFTIILIIYNLQTIKDSARVLKSI